MKKTYTFILILVAVLSVAAFVVLGMSSKNIQTTACTMEAKLCPDGSAVGRTGPNCEFAACPEVVTPPPAPVKTTGNVVLSIGQEGKVGDLTITVNSLVSDSRCPIDVQCIWAGEFKVNVTLADMKKSETRDMSSTDKPYSFDGHSISITNATSGKYRITFHVTLDEKRDIAGMGTISGRVTLSPTCPVDRTPPDPQCAPKPYQIEVEVWSDSGPPIKSTQTRSDGSFTFVLPFGSYTILANEGAVYSRCPPVVVQLTSASSTADIPCDSGIR